MILDHNDNRLADAWAVTEPVLNLAQLNSEATKLDLIIQTTQKLDHSLWKPSGKVSCRKVIIFTSTDK